MLRNKSVSHEPFGTKFLSSNCLTLLCLWIYQEGGLKLTFQKQGLPMKRPLESEEGPQAQQQYLARLQELQSASDTGLADITKPQSSYQTGELI